MRVNQKAIWIVGFFLLLPCLSWAQETEKYNIALEGRYGKRGHPLKGPCQEEKFLLRKKFSFSC